MVWKDHIASANTAPISSTCACIQTEPNHKCLYPDPGVDLQKLWPAFPTHRKPGWGGTIQCERCPLVESLRKQMGELQEEVARLRSICAQEESIDSIHMETS
ncbi:hypothetical protein KIL84_009799 [Mauremys mutica]|uniref:Uncharacterized protein n=1 Tax=Mauremys mutica TaxID=74926 RepID=A0A9D3XN07_9SAUR|nr:hypothetical protein KIL84_009799 [Mauremys mutica]